jgi:hypothetical protein
MLLLPHKLKLLNHNQLTQNQQLPTPKMPTLQQITITTIMKNLRRMMSQMPLVKEMEKAPHLLEIKQPDTLNISAQ